MVKSTGVVHAWEMQPLVHAALSSEPHSVASTGAQLTLKEVTAYKNFEM
ncbi:unnamed protein product [Larinioides sclopetarius]|uniref:Uncharacterized protein n=1 Tax=Larinioides sclopetarius TaxID=280406 RepID=A0AAV2B0N4_9ARAC